MTIAEELWNAVVAHCKPGRGYRIGIGVAGARLTLSREAKPEVYVEPDATGGWLVVVGSEAIASRYTADSAVWLAESRAAL